MSSSSFSSINYEIQYFESFNFVGRVLIFSFEKFDGDRHEERSGHDLDCKSLMFLFHKLNYEVIIEVNKSYSEVCDIIKRTGLQRHSGIFICFVLSHGVLTNSFFTSDGGQMCLMKDIVVPLSKYAGIKNTVKVYIGNFCRLPTEHYLRQNSSPIQQHQLSFVPLHATDTSTPNILRRNRDLEPQRASSDDELFVCSAAARVSNFSGDTVFSDSDQDENIGYLHNLNINLMRSDSGVQSDDNVYGKRSANHNKLPTNTNTINNSRRTIPDTASQDRVEYSHLTDTVVLYSTLPGCSSYRNEVSGSLLVKTLVRVIQGQWKKWDLLRIINKCNEQMQQEWMVATDEDEDSGADCSTLEEVRQYLHVELFGVSKQIVLYPTINAEMAEWLHSSVALHKYHNDADRDAAIVTLLPYTVSLARVLMRSGFGTFETLLQNRTQLNSNSAIRALYPESIALLSDSHCEALSSILQGDGAVVLSEFGLRYSTRTMCDIERNYSDRDSISYSDSITRDIGNSDSGGNGSDNSSMNSSSSSSNRILTDDGTAYERVHSKLSRIVSGLKQANNDNNMHNRQPSSSSRSSKTDTSISSKTSSINLNALYSDLFDAVCASDLLKQILNDSSELSDTLYCIFGASFHQPILSENARIWVKKSDFEKKTVPKSTLLRYTCSYELGKQLYNIAAHKKQRQKHRATATNNSIVSSSNNTSNGNSQEEQDCRYTLEMIESICQTLNINNYVHNGNNNNNSLGSSNSIPVNILTVSRYFTGVEALLCEFAYQLAHCAAVIRQEALARSANRDLYYTAMDTLVATLHKLGLSINNNLPCVFNSEYWALCVVLLDKYGTIVTDTKDEERDTLVSKMINFEMCIHVVL